MPDRRNVRISVRDTLAAIRTCIIHGPVTIEATGSIWTTLALSDVQIESLSRVGIAWQFD